MAGIVQNHGSSATTDSTSGPRTQPLSDEQFVGGQEMPLPSDLRIIFDGGLFLLALLAALYAAREVVLPVVLAVILNLLLQPALRMLERLHVPRVLGAFLLIGLLFGTIVAFGTALSGPAGAWAAKLPDGVPRLQEHLSFLRAPIEAVRQFLLQAQGYVSGNGQSTAGTPQAPLIGSGLWLTMFSGTRHPPGNIFRWQYGGTPHRLARGF
jgi:AI-2E family transporter